MGILERMPFKARKAVFDRLEQMASKANMTVEERQQYETEWKIYNDYFNTIDSAKREGRAEGIEKGMKEGIEKGMKEGRAEGKTEMARNLKAMGIPTETIMKASGLTLEEIEKL